MRKIIAALAPCRSRCLKVAWVLIELKVIQTAHRQMNMKLQAVQATHRLLEAFRMRNRELSELILQLMLTQMMRATNGDWPYGNVATPGAHLTERLDLLRSGPHLRQPLSGEREMLQGVQMRQRPQLQFLPSCL